MRLFSSICYKLTRARARMLRINEASGFTGCAYIPAEREWMKTHPPIPFLPLARKQQLNSSLLNDKLFRSRLACESSSSSSTWVYLANQLCSVWENWASDRPDRNVQLLLCIMQQIRSIDAHTCMHGYTGRPREHPKIFRPSVRSLPLFSLTLFNCSAPARHAQCT